MKDTIVLHHSANPSPRPQADSIIAQHLREPNIRQAGAYHYVIEHDGTAVRLHDEDFIGHHAGNWIMNTRSIGICLAGDFTRTKVTHEQVATLARLVTDIQTRWGIPDTRILLHREVKRTACPGTDLRQIVIDGKRELLKLQLADLQQAEPKAKGSRKLRLQRRIVRILRILA